MPNLSWTKITGSPFSRNIAIIDRAINGETKINPIKIIDFKIIFIIDDALYLDIPF